MTALELTPVWDKTFPSERQGGARQDHLPQPLRHRAGGRRIQAEARAANGRFKAIAVSGPFGAVKEQASGLYAQTLAERGFLTIAFDPSFTGESGGSPRAVASPDINTEDFSAAVDYLANRTDVDPEGIGIVGICGFGAWHSTRPRTTRASRPPWRAPCTT